MNFASLVIGLVHCHFCDKKRKSYQFILYNILYIKFYISNFVKEVDFGKSFNRLRSLYIKIATKCNKINEKTSFKFYKSIQSDT